MDLPAVHTIYKMDMDCSDIERNAQELKSIEACFANTTKHIYCIPANMRSARIWTEMANIRADGKSLGEYPILSFSSSSKSPLKMSDFETDITRHMIDNGVPYLTLPCPLAGATAPFPLAGTLVMIVAETLFLVMLAQMIKPGHPVMQSTGATILNMTSGNCSNGAVEKSMLSVAAAEMAGLYHWPAAAAMMQVDVTRFDVQNGSEAAASANLIAGSPAISLRTGIGTIGNACGVSTEQILNGYDILAMVEHCHKGIDVNDHTLAFDAIKQQGPGGQYFTDDLTLELMRSGEHFYEGSFDRSDGDEAQNSMYERAHRRAERILEEHKPAVPERIVENVRRFVEDNADRTNWD